MLLSLSLALAADPIVEDLLARGEAQTEAYEELVELCDDVGPRLSGSKNLDRAVRWARRRMEQDGLKVQLQPVDVPHWVRGAESASLLAPVSEPLTVLGLGLTVATPEGGIEAPVVVARSWEELEALGSRVKGKIVMLDPPWEGYGETVEYRVNGPDRAAKLGAVAVLLRSVTNYSLNTPHTGMLSYEGETRIPAAAITHESADRIRRWSERGRMVRVKLLLSGKQLDDAPSANVIGDVLGSEQPDEVVVLACHLDSWDVGTGAQDDGAACVAVMEAVALIASLDTAPKRTVRAVLYTNEENGLAGGKAYVEANKDLHHVVMIESDTGMGGTLGFRVDAGLSEKDENLAAAEAYIPALRELLQPLGVLGVSDFEAGYAGADVGPTLRANQGLGLGVKHDMSDYWKIHHTQADTVDKVDPAQLQKEVAALAATAWILANTDTLPEG